MAWIKDLGMGMSRWPGGIFWRTSDGLDVGSWLSDKILGCDGRYLVAVLYSHSAITFVLKIQLCPDLIHIYSNICVFLNH